MISNLFYKVYTCQNVKAEGSMNYTAWKSALNYIKHISTPQISTSSLFWN